MCDAEGAQFTQSGPPQPWTPSTRHHYPPLFVFQDIYTPLDSAVPSPLPRTASAALLQAGCFRSHESFLRRAEEDATLLDGADHDHLLPSSSLHSSTSSVHGDLSPARVLLDAQHHDITGTAGALKKQSSFYAFKRETNYREIARGLMSLTEAELLDLQRIELCGWFRYKNYAAKSHVNLDLGLFDSAVTISTFCFWTLPKWTWRFW